MNHQHTPNTDYLLFTFLFTCATLFAVCTAPIHADPPEQNEIAKLLPVPGIELGRFGKSVSIDGDTLVVGAPNYVPEPTGPGLVYIYNRDAQGNWVEHANLVVCDAACGDGFGRAVSIDGDTIIVGAPAAANSEITGAAYIFTRNQQGEWTQQAKLEVADPQITNLGGSVALQGNTAVVGMISSAITDVFIFERDQNGHWSHESTLTAPGTNSTNSLAIQGDTIIVGAPFFSNDNNQTTIGAVYIFTRDEKGNWTQQAQLLDPNPVFFYNAFGGSVAFDSNTLVIGSLTFSVSRAYIFDRNEQGDWLMQQVLDPDGNSSPDNFGASVAIQGDTLVVGASHDAPSGSAHIFKRDENGIWLEHAKLLQSDAGSNDVFGAAVAFDNETIIVGARGDDDNGSSSGSAYVFDAAGTTGKCPWDLDDDAVVGVSDLLVLLAAWGPVPTPDPPDFDGDGFVGVSDLLALLGNWGPCP